MGEGTGIWEAGSGVGRGRREAQRARRTNGNLQLLEVGISRKNQKPRMEKAAGVKAGDFSQDT